MPLVQKNVAFVRTIFAIRHEITAEGVHVNPAITGIAECIFGCVKFPFIDCQPSLMRIRKVCGLAPIEQRLLEE
jgi:hypothetical protein